MPVKKNYNTGKFMDELAKIVTAAVAEDINNKAKSIVRVGTTGNLKGSINFEKNSDYEWTAYSQTEYAAAQEWGLAPFGKPNYSFTPYMRPASQDAIQPANLRKIYDGATPIALSRSRV
jgi:hypothetical protein